MGKQSFRQHHLCPRFASDQHHHLRNISSYEPPFSQGHHLEGWLEKEYRPFDVSPEQTSPTLSPGLACPLFRTDESILTFPLWASALRCYSNKQNTINTSHQSLLTVLTIVLPVHREAAEAEEQVWRVLLQTHVLSQTTPSVLMA